jgi:hypothetical protein
MMMQLNRKPVIAAHLKKFPSSWIGIIIRKASKEAYSKMSSSPTIAEAFLGKEFTRFQL